MEAKSEGWASGESAADDGLQRVEALTVYKRFCKYSQGFLHSQEEVQYRLGIKNPDGLANFQKTNIFWFPERSNYVPLDSFN